MGGDAFVLKWAAVPANIVAGHHWTTILTAIFMHGSWSHIIGNMGSCFAYSSGSGLRAIHWSNLPAGGGILP